MKSTADAAVAELVSQTRIRAANSGSAALRDAFREFLRDLHVPESEMPAWSDGVDVVGRAYEELFSVKQRRQAGQFFTPFWAGELMASWLLSQPVRTLLDPAVGSGALLIPAARHPGRGAAGLIGIDVDPLAIRMAEVNRRLRAMEGLDLRVANFLLDSLQERPDALMVNPPYSRHHDIDPTAKDAIHKGFEDRLDLTISRLAALHVLFLVRALEVSSDNARMAFITPSDWLNVKYGRAVKRFLLDRAYVEAIVVFEADHLFFDGMRTTAAITFIDKGADPQRPTKILRLGRTLPTPTQVLKTLAAKRSSKIARVRLATDTAWGRTGVASHEGVRLGDVARIRRGAATGCNNFFVLSEASRREVGLPTTQLRLCATGPRAFTGAMLTEADFAAMDDHVPRWIINCTDPSEETSDTPLGRYLRWGKQALGVHLGYLASSRSPWYAPEQRGDCPLLFSYFNRPRPRFVRNLAGALPLNTWLILEPTADVDADRLLALLTSAAVCERLRMAARVYGGGLWKLEPSELADVRLPSEVYPGA